MAKTFEELRSLKENIRTSNLPESNSASKVGGMLGDLIDKEEETFNNINTKLVGKVEKTYVDGELAKKVSKSSVHIYNLDFEKPLQEGYYTLETAIAAVPEDVQKGGMQIKFFDGNNYSSYECISSAWSTDAAKWRRVVNDYDFAELKKDLNGQIIKEESNYIFGTAAQDYIVILDKVTDQINVRVDCNSNFKLNAVYQKSSGFVTLCSIIFNSNNVIQIPDDSINNKLYLSKQATSNSYTTNIKIWYDGINQNINGIKENLYQSNIEITNINETIDANGIYSIKVIGSLSNQFFKMQETKLEKGKLYITIRKINSNFNFDNFALYGLGTSIDGISIKSYSQVTWTYVSTDEQKGYVILSEDYFVITGSSNGSEILLSNSIDQRIKTIESSVNNLKNGTIYNHCAIISFIDDDSGKYAPEIWGSIISQTSIKIGFACVAGMMAGQVAGTGVYEQMTIDQLREFYNNGHEVYSHSWSHPAFYEAGTTIDMIEEECWKSRTWLLENGFNRNSDIIVYPGGLGGIEETNPKVAIIRRHYRYGVDTTGGSYNVEPMKHYTISRVNADTSTFNELKDKVDNAILNNGHLVFMNHAYELNKDKTNQIQKMVDIINYIKTTNAIIIPLDEGIRQIYGW